MNYILDGWKFHITEIKMSPRSENILLYFLTPYRLEFLIRSTIPKFSHGIHRMAPNSVGGNAFWAQKFLRISKTVQSSKESESRNLTSVMQKLISAQKMENILRNGAPEPPTLNELAATDPLVAGVVADLKKDKKQKQRVGVNPVLGNAGVMWESNKKVKWHPKSWFRVQT